MRRLASLFFSLFLCVLIFFPGCKNRKINSETAELDELDSVEEELPVEDIAETTMKALYRAYPDQISPAEFRDGDWAFLIGEKWFYYAEGRVLPEELRGEAAEYRAMRVNRNYRLELAPWSPPPERPPAERPPQTQNSGEGPNRRQPSSTSLDFYEAIWNIRSRDDAYKQMAEIDFLGHTLKIHSALKSKVQHINEIIMNESKTNATVGQWIDSLGIVQGLNWRNVANSRSRSYHSYGIAIDLLPENLNGLATYWQWSSQQNPNWRAIPYSGRYHPPDVVISTFESFGFIWGGKWPNYDTMHFEYHPEVFILSGIPIME